MKLQVRLLLSTTWYHQWAPLENVVNKQSFMKEAIEEIAAISEENAAGIEQVSASSQEMNG